MFWFFPFPAGPIGLAEIVFASPLLALFLGIIMFLWYPYIISFVGFVAIIHLCCIVFEKNKVADKIANHILWQGIFGGILLSYFLKLYFNSFFLSFLCAFVYTTILTIFAVFASKDKTLKRNLILFAVVSASITSSLFYFVKDGLNVEISSNKIGFVTNPEYPKEVKELLPGSHTISFSDDIYILPTSKATYSWLQGRLKLRGFSCDLIIDVNWTPKDVQMFFNKNETKIKSKSVYGILDDNIRNSIYNLTDQFSLEDMYRNKETVLKKIMEVVKEELHSIGIDNFSSISLELNHP